MLCAGGALGSKKPPQLFWQAEVGVSLSSATRDGGCRIKPAGLAGTRRDDIEWGRETGDSSYRLPFAAPQSGRPLHHHGIALHARS